VTKDNNDDKKLEDSVKTHPDCKLRIKILEPIVERVNKPGTQLYLQGQQQFAQWQQVFSFEEINHCFASKKLSLCLFNSIKLMDKYPQNAYLAAITGKCFNEFYEKQKSHHLNNIVDNPSPFREKNYNTLLEFISKLSLTDIGNIGYQFMKQHSTTLATDADFSKAFEQAQKNYNETKSK